MVPLAPATVRHRSYGPFAQPRPRPNPIAPVLLKEHLPSYARPNAPTSRGERFDTVMHFQANTVAQRNEQRRLSPVRRYTGRRRAGRVGSKRYTRRGYMRAATAVPYGSRPVDIRYPKMWPGLGESDLAGLEGLEGLGQLDGWLKRLFRRRKQMKRAHRRLVRRAQRAQSPAAKRGLLSKIRRQVIELAKNLAKIQRTKRVRGQLVTRLKAENVLVPITPQQYEAMRRAKLL